VRQEHYAKARRQSTTKAALRGRLFFFELFLRLHAGFLEVGTGVPLLHPCDLETLWRMTRAQRALACAIGIIPVSAAGIVLVRCHCTLAAYTIELTTAIAYVIFILVAPRSQT
jgi:hypothetical protein